jgi:hypothetical protein
LRPLSISEILDGAFATLRSSPGATLGLAFLTSAVLELVFIAIAAAERDRSFWFYAVLQAVLGGLHLMLVMLLAGVLALVVAEGSLGRRVTLGAAARQVAPRLPGLAAITVALTGVILLGLVTLGVVSVWLGVTYCLATPAYMLEGGTVGGALRRSRDLMRGAWWRTLGILGLATVVAATLVLVVEVPASLFTVDSTDSGTPTTAALITQAIAALITTVVVTPMQAGLLAILYLDRRIRREALDVTLARATATGGGAATGAPATVLLAVPSPALAVPPPPPGRWS